jgi:hypothetical protein
MKQWLLILLVAIFSIYSLFFIFFKFSLTPAQAGVSVTAHISAICGNNIKEEGEQCDGSDLGGQTCTSLGYSGGTLSCYSNCTFNTSNCFFSGGGGGGGAPPPPPPTQTMVVLQGKAYPLAKITILKDGEVGQITNADINANFKAEIKNISGGVWNFSLWAEDSKGRRSITISFAVTILEGKITTISNIFIPPTIELEKTRLAKGEELNIFGQSAPESQISIHVESSQEIIKTTMAKRTGDWDYSLDTSPLEEGMHTTRAKAESPEGLKSAFSSVLAFFVGKYKVGEICPRADFNKDGKTNLIDFSILLYWWGKYNPCVDMNGDGIVNLPDFSILLYYWTG